MLEEVLLLGHDQHPVVPGAGSFSVPASSCKRTWNAKTSLVGYPLLELRNWIYLLICDYTHSALTLLILQTLRVVAAGSIMDVEYKF